jgi:hypothetical protein
MEANFICGHFNVHSYMDEYHECNGQSFTLFSLLDY